MKITGSAAGEIKKRVKKKYPFPLIYQERC